jgi:DNA polymerase-3 subunit delta
MALREARVWGVKEKLFERALPLLNAATLAQLLHAAQVCDGLVKGLKHPDWPSDPWDGLERWVLMSLERTSVTAPGPRGRAVVITRLALGV